MDLVFAALLSMDFAMLLTYFLVVISNVLSVYIDAKARVRDSEDKMCFSEEYDGSNWVDPPKAFRLIIHCV